jgi:glycosyltransferase involved in cell wall biosynthesis
MKDNPLVSIIAICYNHSEFLKETLDSIKNQTYSNIQLIIMDDCSKDNSVILINEWIKENNVACTFIAHEKNQGLCKTLNEALSHVKGIFFQGFACDDIMMLDKIEKNVQTFLNADENLAVVHSDAEVIDKNGIKLFDSYHDTYDYPKTEPKNYRHAILSCPLLLAPSVLIKTKIIEELGNYDENYFIDDWPMWMKISRKYSFAKINEKLIKYRYLDTSMSHGNTSKIKVARSAISLLKNEMETFPEESEIIKSSLKHYLEKLILFDVISSRELWLKFIIDKKKYSFYLFLMSIIGFKASKSSKLKKMVLGS